MKKHSFTGKTEYFMQDAVPEKYKKELDLVMDNVKVIHGPLFAQHVKFMLNMDSLLGIMITNMSVNDDCDEDELRQIIVHISVQLAASHFEALGIDEDDESAIYKTVNTLRGIVATMQKERNKERGES